MATSIFQFKKKKNALSSSECPLGVPQRSYLGPILFLYTRIYISAFEIVVIMLFGDFLRLLGVTKFNRDCLLHQ